MRNEWLCACWKSARNYEFVRLCWRFNHFCIAEHCVVRWFSWKAMTRTVVGSPSLSAEKLLAANLIFYPTSLRPDRRHFTVLSGKRREKRREKVPFGECRSVTLVSCRRADIRRLSAESETNIVTSTSIVTRGLWFGFSKKQRNKIFFHNAQRCSI